MYRIGKEEIEAVARVIESKKLFKTQGPETKSLEAELCELFNVGNAIAMTSGHAALTSALIAMGIGPGDEVIVPAYTYIATAMAVVAAGAVPVIAESDETLTIDPVDVEKKITKNTKAIIPVHIQGFPCDMDKIMAIAKKHGLYVLEDSCQGDGGAYKGKRLGTIGDCGALSFNVFKIISAGEGGAFFTSNPKFYARALIYHDSSAVAFFGDQLDGIDEPVFCGHEFRTNEISSAILRVQLTRLDGILKDLRANKKYLMELLAPHFAFAPSNDIEGDCGTTLSLKFDTIEEAQAYSAESKLTSPINTDKHVFCNWTAIMEKRGAFNPAFDPFKLEANKAILPNYSKDMCPKTLEILAKNVYVSINPDWTKAEIEEYAKKLIAFKK